MKFSIVNIVLSMVLLSSLFYVGVTSSIAVYDPYADYDQDGDIDIYDVVPMADAYGTEGNSTRNVTVTNFPSVWQTNTTNLPIDEQGNLKVNEQHMATTLIVVEDYLVHIGPWFEVIGLLNVEGYKEAGVFAYLDWYTDDPVISLYICSMANGIHGSPDTIYLHGYDDEEGKRVGIFGPTLELSLYSGQIQDCIITVVVYLMD